MEPRRLQSRELAEALQQRQQRILMELRRLQSCELAGALSNADSGFS